MDKIDTYIERAMEPARRRMASFDNNVSVSLSLSKSYSEHKDVVAHEKYMDEKSKEHDKWWQWWIRNTPQGEQHAMNTVEWVKDAVRKYGCKNMAEVDAFYERFSKLRESRKKNCKIAQMSDEEFIKFIKEHG